MHFPGQRQDARLQRDLAVGHALDAQAEVAAPGEVGEEHVAALAAEPLGAADETRRVLVARAPAKVRDVDAPGGDAPPVRLVLEAPAPVLTQALAVRRRQGQRRRGQPVDGVGGVRGVLERRLEGGDVASRVERETHRQREARALVGQADRHRLAAHVETAALEAVGEVAPVAVAGERRGSAPAGARLGEHRQRRDLVETGEGEGRVVVHEQGGEIDVVGQAHAAPVQARHAVPLEHEEGGPFAVEASERGGVGHRGSGATRADEACGETRGRRRRDRVAP